jgi:hypothetical protein
MPGRQLMLGDIAASSPPQRWKPLQAGLLARAAATVDAPGCRRRCRPAIRRSRAGTVNEHSQSLGCGAREDGLVDRAPALLVLLAPAPVALGDRMLARQELRQAFELAEAERRREVGEPVIVADLVMDEGDPGQLGLGREVPQPRRQGPSAVVSMPPPPVVMILLPLKLKQPMRPMVPTCRPAQAAVRIVARGSARRAPRRHPRSGHPVARRRHRRSVRDPPAGRAHAPRSPPWAAGPRPAPAHRGPDQMLRDQVPRFALAVDEAEVRAGSAPDWRWR